MHSPGLSESTDIPPHVQETCQPNHEIALFRFVSNQSFRGFTIFHPTAPPPHAGWRLKAVVLGWAVAGVGEMGPAW